MGVECIEKQNSMKYLLSIVIKRIKIFLFTNMGYILGKKHKNVSKLNNVTGMQT